MSDPRDEENEAPTTRADGAELRPCKQCGSPLIIVPGPDGKRIPLDARSPIFSIRADLTGHAVAEPLEGAFVSHFFSCPKRGPLLKGGRK